MKIFSMVFICLLTLPVLAAEPPKVLAQLTELEKALASAAKKEADLVTKELDRKRAQPAYQPEYMSRTIVRDYHRQADRAAANIIALKKQYLAATTMSGPGCAQAVAQYRAETFQKLQELYHKFVAREPPFPLVSSMYGANERDSLGFITQVVMSCGM